MANSTSDYLGLDELEYSAFENEKEVILSEG